VLSRRQPAPHLAILETEQPMLMSIASGLEAATIAAASRIMTGSAPKICTATGRSSSQNHASWRVFSCDFSPPITSALDETSSLQLIPAPYLRQRRRNGEEVTPAIGARTILGSTVIPAICIQQV